MIIGQALSPTGYARVIDSLLPFLVEAVIVYYFGINSNTQPVSRTDWVLLPNPNKEDIYGLEILPAVIKQARPTVVLLVNDLYVYSIYKPYLKAGCPAAKIILYGPVHGIHLRRDYLNQLKGLDRLVLFTESARNEVYNSLSLDGSLAKGFPATEVIGHGLNLKQFYPLAPFSTEDGFSNARQLARRHLFPHLPEVNKGFIILNANRNQSRKRLDITMEAFAQFVQNKPPEVYLYLHTGLLDKGVDLISLINLYNLQARILLTSLGQYHPNVSETRLNYIYNACDVGINTSTGEGWGLTSFEHAAAGGAQIVPKHSACAELWDGIASFVEPYQAFTLPFELATQQIVSAKDVAHQMNSYYKNTTYLRTQSWRAFQYVSQPIFSWSKIAQQWLSLFESLLF